MKLFLFFFLSCYCLVANTAHRKNIQKRPITVAPKIKARPASLGIIGDTADVNTITKGGSVLMGGSTDVDAAFQWMINRSGGGDVVILRASGTDAYNSYADSLGEVNSVETLKIDSRALADNDTVAYIIRHAEMLFIAGGDQSNYMKYWRGTKTMAAINYLLNIKHVPVGGTSAGCAIMGGYYYSGEFAGITSQQALTNPYDSLVRVYDHDFLHAPFLSHVITDQHYIKRNRQGRHVVFLSRIIKDHGVFANGVAADEKTAVCIDEHGKAKVFGKNSAYFLITDPEKKPEICLPGTPLTWNNNHQAVRVYELQGSEYGGGSFDAASFNPHQAHGGKWYWWWVENGELKQAEAK